VGTLRDRDNGIGGGCDAGSEKAQEPPSPSGPSDGGGGGDLDCSDFSRQKDAQEVLDRDRSDPNGLDVEGEGWPVRAYPETNPNYCPLWNAGHLSMRPDHGSSNAGQGSVRLV
jgi:hypothetical protein